MPTAGVKSTSKIFREDSVQHLNEKGKNGFSPTTNS